MLKTKSTPSATSNSTNVTIDELEQYIMKNIRNSQFLEIEKIKEKMSQLDSGHGQKFLLVSRPACNSVI